MQRRHRLAVSILLVGLASLALAGCDRQGLVAPTAESGQSAEHAWVGDKLIPAFETYGWSPTELHCPAVAETSVSKSIGYWGGSISFGNHTLVVPQGALSSRVTITATQVEGSEIAVDFQPHGLVFQKPVRLTLGYGYCSPPPDFNLEMLYVIGSTALEWVNTSNDTVDHLLSGDLHHFSKYVIAY